MKKAVRDKIPSIIRKSGCTCNAKKLSNSKFLVELEKKLYEEIKEYGESKKIEELADIIEVILAIAKLKGTSRKKLEKIRIEKLNQRGGFEKNLFLIDSGKKQQ